MKDVTDHESKSKSKNISDRVTDTDRMVIRKLNTYKDSYNCDMIYNVYVYKCMM